MMIRGRKCWGILLVVLLSLAFSISGFMLLENHHRASAERAQFETLRQYLETAPTEIVVTEDKYPSAEAAQEPPEPTMLPHMAELYGQNPDIAAWIRIEGTNIDYPVMLTPSEPHKYLNLGFDGQYSKSGVPFFGGASMEDENLVIHGHNMKNETMFSDLLPYEDADFYKDHKVICLDTLYEQQRFEVVAAFRSRAYRTDEHGFRYYRYNNFGGKEDFDAFMTEVNQFALYPATAKASYGDQLLTLSTCAYHEPNGRFVVVAKEIK